MSERKDEQWLDSQLQRAINGNTPGFDAEAWKRKHQDEYQTLVSRGKQDAQTRWGKPRPTIWIVRFAVAAAIAVAVGLFVTGRNGPDRPTEPRGPVAQSAASKMSMMSLRAAYQQGGFEALDRQLHDTLDEFGPRSSSVPVQRLFSM